MTKSTHQPSLFPETHKTISDTFSVSADIVFSLGDSLDILTKCPDNFATLIITSPPYNMGKEYETQTKLEHYLEQIQGPRLCHVRKRASHGCRGGRKSIDDCEVQRSRRIHHPRPSQ